MASNKIKKILFFFDSRATFSYSNNIIKVFKKYKKPYSILLYVILLGFSQGGATAARWYYSQPKLFSHFILWASVFPPDIEKPNKAIEQSYFVVGDKDEFLTNDLLEKELAAYQNLGFETIRYEGNHDIEPNALSSLLERI